MSITFFSTLGHRCWLVSQRNRIGFMEAHAHLEELEPRTALWVLRSVQGDGELHGRAFEPASRACLPGREERHDFEQRLSEAIATGEVSIYLEPRRFGAMSQEIPEEQISDLMDEAPAEAVQHWIEVRLVDEDGNPRAQEPYSVVLADGTEMSGTLDDDGVARLPDLPRGPCEWSFPELAPEDWQAA